MEERALCVCVCAWGMGVELVVGEGVCVCVCGCGGGFACCLDCDESDLCGVCADSVTESL